MLNGYNIKSGGAFPNSGAMRSFKVVEGDLWHVWNVQQIVTLRDEAGQESKIRIAAFPAEEGASGFVEFI